MSATIEQQARSLFANYQSIFESYLEKSLDRFTFPESSFEEACLYTLQAGGKRFRPVLVLMVADACGGCDARESALAVELFHTASLVIDDLPCMDNEAYRRGKPTVHSHFGEGTSILSTYALISEAFDCLRRNVEVARKNQSPFVETHDLLGTALLHVCRTLGINGVTGGQFLDLYCHDPSSELVFKTLDMKTGALFEASFALGWIFGGGNPDLLPRVISFAHHFGRAFQIADDLEDYEEDLKIDRKMNLAVSAGREKAGQAFKDSLKSAMLILEELNVSKNSLHLLCEYLRQKGEAAK